jgi:hypothetical protein
MSSSPHSHSAGHKTSNLAASRAMGIASVAVGLSELLMPEKIEQTLGLPNGEDTGIIRVLGVREVFHGVDLLTHHNPTPGILARVAGDLLDGAVLAAAAKKSRNSKGLLTILALVAPIVLADMILAPRLLTD